VSPDWLSTWHYGGGTRLKEVGGKVVSIPVKDGSGERQVVRGASLNQPGVSYGPNRPIYLSY
jgi:hypothetical protein